MTTYDYLTLADFYGRLKTLDWVESLSSPDETTLSSISTAKNPKLLVSYDDASDSQLKHITKAAADSDQLVLGDGKGLEIKDIEHFKKLKFERNYDDHRITLKNFIPEVNMRFLVCYSVLNDVNEQGASEIAIYTCKESVYDSWDFLLDRSAESTTEILNTGYSFLKNRKTYSSAGWIENSDSIISLGHQVSGQRYNLSLKVTKSDDNTTVKDVTLGYNTSQQPETSVKYYIHSIYLIVD